MFLNVPSDMTIYSYKNSCAEKYCQEKNIKFVALEGFDLTVTTDGYSKVYIGNEVKDEPVFVVNGADDYVVRYSKGESFDYANSCTSIEELGNFYRNHNNYYSRIPGYLKDVGAYTISCCVYTNGSNPTYSTVTINIIDCLRGDTDCDGKLSVLDASLIQLFLVGKKDLQENSLISADFDQDNKITVLDASAIQLRLVGKL